MPLLPIPLLVLLLTTLNPVSAYAIVEPFSQPTATLSRRQQTPAQVPNLAAASISASLASSFSSRLTIETQSLQQVVAGLERNLAETRRGLSLAQAQVVSQAEAAGRVGAANPDPSTTDGRATALPDTADCQTTLPRPQALCSGTARTLSIVGFVIGGIGLIALGFLSIVCCRRLQRQKLQEGRDSKRSMGDAAPTSTPTRTRQEKQGVARIGGSLFGWGRKVDGSGDVAEKYTGQNNRAPSQRKRFQGGGSRSEAPGHMSISAPQPGSGPIRSEEERNANGRPQPERQLDADSQDRSGETLTFMLSPDYDTYPDNRASMASRDRLIGPDTAGRRYSRESNVIPAGDPGSIRRDMSSRSVAGGGAVRDSLSREYHEFMESVVRPGDGRMGVSTEQAPGPTILAPTRQESKRMRERLI